MIPVVGGVAVILASTLTLRQTKERRRWWPTALLLSLILTAWGWVLLAGRESSPVSISDEVASSTRISGEHINGDRMFYLPAGSESGLMATTMEGSWLAHGSPSRIDVVLACSDPALVIVEWCREETLVVTSDEYTFRGLEMLVGDRLAVD